MNKVNKYAISLLLTITNLMSVNAMQPQCSITDMPQEIIRHIAGYFERRRDLYALANTCRFLHDSTTQENKEIYISCLNRRGQLPVKTFLDKVFACMQHVVARNGNNTIYLAIGGNNLADDMPALSEFLSRCSQSPVGNYLAELNLGYNQLHAIPEGLKSLNLLKRLDLTDNFLKKEDLHVLETYINESLKELKTIDVSCNPPLKMSDVWNTLAHCGTLESVCAMTDDLVGYMPTPEQLDARKAMAISCSY